MKPTTRQFLKFGMIVWAPTYAIFLWIFLQLGFNYWVSVALANTTYTFTMFPLYRKGVFEL